MKLILLVLIFTHFGFGQEDQNGECTTNPRLKNAIKSSMSEVLQTGSSIGNQCPYGWERILDSCYLLSPSFDYENFENAAERCKILSPGKSRLFEPKDKWSNNLVYKWINTLYDNSEVEYYPWIGIHDKFNEGQFVYESSNATLIFENFYDGEVDYEDSTENCVAMGYSSYGKWYAESCTEAKQFICEITL